MRMKKFSLCVFFGMFICLIQAQTIEGNVFDANTKEALQGVVVYLDGTSIAAITDMEGHFSLVVKQKINANLVLSLMSYERMVIERPFELKEKNFFLKEKSNTLSAARVVSDRSTIEDILFFGDMGGQRMGEMLPRNYRLLSHFVP